MDTPLISFVVAAQNISTHGNLIERLNESMNTVRAVATNTDLPSEYILVEWNPPADRPSLAEALEWKDWECPARLITVSREIHESLPNPHGQLFFEWIAKNVGIRRSEGKFIVCMNADDIITVGLMYQLRKLKEDSFYRANRYDVKALGEPAFMVKRASGDFAPGEDFTQSKTGVPYSEQMLHFNASGDFMAMSRENWLKLRGYPEVPYDGSVDGQMVWIAHNEGLHQVVLQETLLHLDHPRGGRVMHTPPWSDREPFGAMNTSESWGLAGLVLPTVEPSNSVS
jgi:hypothetical protein